MPATRTPKMKRIPNAKAVGMVILGLSAFACASCATLSPEEETANSETRFQQEMLHPPDPGNGR